MLLGVLALVFLMPKKEPANPPDPERAVIWLHDEAKQQNLLILLVESRSEATLTAVPLPGAFALDGTAVDMGAVFRSRSFSASHRELEAVVGRSIHRRLGIPTDVLATLIDAAGGVDMEGARMGGAQAIQWLLSAQGGEQAARATTTFLALLDAVNMRGIAMGMSEGLALARKVETNGDLLGLQSVFERWSSYGVPRVSLVASPDGSVNLAELQEALRDDPAPEEPQG